ncbi:MAG: hypothetical protein KDJ86_16615 [Bauldia sp.]|uniref:hypothetical protein n=1 Tax=Bauldia sp. TaxID=2575872 RepID=UPI001E04FAC5|nr:hypothetical protein [Bauldia sp.]MCB1497404.1 hypothetical protein [Bauldia sp.]
MAKKTDAESLAEAEAIRRRMPEIHRMICTALGLAEICTFKACRRARRCTTADVVCYQRHCREIHVMIRPFLEAKAAGRPMPAWPASEEEWEALIGPEWPDSTAPDKLSPD